MITHTYARRASTRCTRPTPIRHSIRLASGQARYPTRPSSRRYLAATAATAAAALAVISFTQWNLGIRLLRPAFAEEPESDPTPRFEAERRKAKSKEDNRNLISSQHLQVQKSWENPGVYAWGANSCRVADPSSDEKFVKTPRWIESFKGILLRDLKLSRQFGAAIDQQGNLLQWGTGYSADCRKPEVTLKGKNLRSLTLSRDRIIALGNDGAVYSIPSSQDEQLTGLKPQESSWIPFLSSSARISYRKLEPKDLAWGEKVTDIAGGLEHVLILTSKGRLFSAAAGSQDFPRHGQMGVPGLTWATRPAGSYDTVHAVSTLNGFHITNIAAGDYHSLAADKEGRVFSFGDNSLGQLGMDYNSDSSIVDVPSLLPIQQLYAGTSQVPKVTGVSAGGSNSYFNIDAIRVASPNDDQNALRRLGNVTSDTWSCGQGIWGNLGNGRWTHVQSTPVKIPSLSGLFEYDEVNNRTVPIRLSRFSVGQTHSAAVMDNITYVHAHDKSSENDTNWGADIVFFGNNESYQLGTGKRNNVSNPIYIQPLDSEAEKGYRGKEPHRFQITPKKKVKVNGRNVELEQRIECGRGVTAVYSGV
ncbi:Regulator of chromosome condensation RCC1 [Venturia nashicola]|uniref:Regulator of chromosome condensation RCC1 n=1 Tax=Venturia nashicola TaxID=86259 RepID=A0A4Z1NEQ1_9PEZI|nr:Regulator of chromosome condensation RCC1 [Venturia nashicola]